MIGQTPVLDDPSRTMETQVLLASVPAVLERTIAAAGVTGLSPEGFARPTRPSFRWRTSCASSSPMKIPAVRRASRASTRESSSATGGSSTRSASEATMAQVDAPDEQLEAAGNVNSPLYVRLADREQQLESLTALRTSNVSVVQTSTAGDAEQVAPRPRRNAALALVAGLVVGLILVSLWETLSTRPRSARGVRGSPWHAVPRPTESRSRRVLAPHAWQRPAARRTPFTRFARISSWPAAQSGEPGRSWSRARKQVKERAQPPRSSESRSHVQGATSLVDLDLRRLGADEADRTRRPARRHVARPGGVRARGGTRRDTTGPRGRARRSGRDERPSRLRRAPRGGRPPALFAATPRRSLARRRSPPSSPSSSTAQTSCSSRRRPSSTPRMPPRSRRDWTVFSSSSSSRDRARPHVGRRSSHGRCMAARQAGLRADRGRRRAAVLSPAPLRGRAPAPDAGRRRPGARVA